MVAADFLERAAVEAAERQIDGSWLGIGPRRCLALIVETPAQPVAAVHDATVLGAERERIERAREPARHSRNSCCRTAPSKRAAVPPALASITQLLLPLTVATSRAGFVSPVGAPETWPRLSRPQHLTATVVRAGSIEGTGVVAAGCDLHGSTSEGGVLWP